MESIKNNINSYLSNLKGAGSFCSIGNSEFIFPQLNVNKLGEISFPINESQAKSLISIAQKAPFGKGMETILDTNVRSAWQIDATDIFFEGDNWANYLTNILSKIKEDLGINHAEISAHLYKLLIYEEGDFFVKHKDTEKEKGMFGSLIIGLPSTYKGGELEISFEDEIVIADFSKNPYQINYTAFYADCDHEVKPLLSGYRVCLVYNLVQENAQRTLSAVASKAHVDNLAEFLSKPIDNKPFVILLGHQYTPENFSIEQLKLNDRLKAEVLLKAADKLGYYSNLCLVTSYLSGSPNFDNYGYGYDDDDDEDAEMGEIIDESIYIENWSWNDRPQIGSLSFDEEDLITSFKINDGDPLIKENTGYMGNYGPDIMHWYHYGAVVIWTRELNSTLISSQSLENKLNWIEYAIQNYENLTQIEISKINELISEGIGLSDSNEIKNYDSIANWVFRNESKSFIKLCNIGALKHYFVKISTEKWFEILVKTEIDTLKYLFENVLKNSTLASVLQWTNFAILGIKNEKLKEIIKSYYLQIDTYLKPYFENKKILGITLTSEIVRNIIELEELIHQDDTHQYHLAEILTFNPTRDYLHSIIIPTITNYPNKTSFAKILLQKSVLHLQELVSNKPLPPANWKREVPQTSSYTKQWATLKAFLEAENMETYEIKAVQNIRNEFEEAIKSVKIDLRTETIKKGSPHTLKITKTKDAYKRAFKNWEEDEILLKKTEYELNNWK